MFLVLSDSMLTFIFSLLFFGILVLFFTPDTQRWFLQTFSLSLAGVVFFYSLLLLPFFEASNVAYQFRTTLDLSFGLVNLYWEFGVDGMALCFIILTTFLIFLCVLFVFDEKLLRHYLIALFLLELLLVLLFSVLDLLLFYIFFEAILIPMFLLVGGWGSRERKVWAAYLLFFYTLGGSLLFLLGILYVASVCGTTSIEYISQYPFSFDDQYWLWLAFFLSFASKIPVFPLHIWLPEAHVEASTVGSVLLAGILLKLGVYGFLRFTLPLFSEASLFFAPFVYILAGFGVIHASLAALRQTDLKRIIAYSSIAHMNLITLGVFSFNYFGFEGALLQSLSHGFVSGALFFLVGILYRRYHTRSVYYYGGLVDVMPLYAVFFLLFTMANIALPGTSSFVGEFLLLLSLFKFNFVLGVLAATSVVLGGSYSLWLYNRLMFGNLKSISLSTFADINLREFFILSPLAILVLLVGIAPAWITYYFHTSVMVILTGYFV